MKLDTFSLETRLIHEASKTFLTVRDVRNGKLIIAYTYDGVEKEFELQMNDFIGYTDF